MQEFLPVVPKILQAFWQMLINPIFWLVVIFVAYQYRRYSRMKEDLFGVKGEPIWQHTLLATGHGIIGGLVGSFLMVLVGISLGDIGIGYLWLLAVLLMFVSPRFLCFSYSGGIISLSYLLLGWPRVDVPQLMGLVAILHMVESVLILVSGHLGAMPIYTRAKDGRVVGGFNLQKFWPIPIVGMLLMQLPGSQVVQGMVSMPEWWPLIKPSLVANLDNVVYLILPVVAGLGYGDLALTSVPEKKSRRTAVFLNIYSLVLLLLAIAASYWPILAISAALFAPLGHEYVIKLGRQSELKGEPLYVSPEEGVMVLDVLRGTAAARAGLKSSDIIKTMNGASINNGSDLRMVLEKIDEPRLEISYINRSGQSVRKVVAKDDREPFGTILVPEPYQQPQVEFGSAGLLVRWWRRLMGKLGRG
ncbi:PDZ domain-containing protein [Metallumcola ferriviriculae]|uniref:PDZ domain-containing protein n=1 Tax=Metallumcola ferriviriculae TaxID=3039180 RepID=A0AAU0UL94_9FIRM|nr:PDZ domain-containing protein [Desulfitibacteraceae bacterium MK1]